MRRMIPALLFGLALLPQTAAAQPTGWRDTALRQLYSTGAGDRYGSLDYTCWDPVNPGQLLVAENGIGIARYDLHTNTRALQIPAGRFNLDGCSETGWLYWGGPEGMLAVQPDSNTLTNISPVPTTFAQDGSGVFYGLTGPTLYYGRLNQMFDIRPTPFSGASVQLQVSGPDNRALYALVLRRPPVADGMTRYELWFSPTGGWTNPNTGGAPWELRWSGEGYGSYGGPYVSFVSLGAALAPVGTLAININPGYPGSSNRTQTLLSNDGGRTFSKIEETSYGATSRTMFAAVRDGVLGLSISTAPYGPRPPSVSLTSDGGRSWQELAAPPVPQPPEPDHVQLVVARAAPQVVAYADDSGTYLSKDSGRSWARVGDPRGQLQFSPYLPLQLLGRNGTTLSVLDVGDLGTGMTAARPALGDQGFAPETGQTISPLFLSYWQRNGGLARFGYPKTQAFREVNAADGKAYLTQYFERARFEYHPENADPQYQVLLGLLGNEQTAGRRAEGPFLPKATPGDPGEVSFAQTGHAIRNSFRRYWEANGGLATYGYPISDEFTEVNPENGQSYVVQYYERNRFEYHPENAGTPYEVLLGLLGNDQLRQKGWQ